MLLHRYSGENGYQPLASQGNEGISVASPASVTSRLLAGGAPLRWFTVGLKHDEIHVTEARSCNQEGDHFWRDPENTNLLGLSDWVRPVVEIIRGKRSEHYQCEGPAVSVSCSIATVTRRQIAAPA